MCLAAASQYLGYSAETPARSHHKTATKDMSMRHPRGHKPSHCTTALQGQGLGEPPALSRCISSLLGLIPAALRTHPAATLPSRCIPPPASKIRGAFPLCTPVPAFSFQGLEMIPRLWNNNSFKYHCIRRGGYGEKKVEKA